MADRRADGAERNHRHDHQRLHIGLQRDRHQRINQEQGQAGAIEQIDHHLFLIPGGAGDTITDAGMMAENVRQLVLDQILGDAAGFGHGFVHPGGDADRTLTIEAADGGRAAAHVQIGHGGEGHGLAVAGANAHVFQITLGPSLRSGIANHDFHFVLASLDALHFLAVERLAHLPCQIPLAQPEQLRFRFDPELDFTHAAVMGITQVVNAVVVPQSLFQFGAGCLQMGLILANQFQ